jgi:hypothetical protein
MVESKNGASQYNIPFRVTDTVTKKNMTVFSGQIFDASKAITLEIISPHSLRGILFRAKLWIHAILHKNKRRK